MISCSTFTGKKIKMAAFPVTIELSEAISNAHDEIVAQRANHHEQALATGGVPVYSDLGGVICITPGGLVRFYDWETHLIRDMHEPAWIEVALVRASALFPTLRALAPVRPHASRECSVCGGRGQLYLNSVCSTCHGRGWERSADEGSGRAY